MKSTRYTLRLNACTCFAFGLLFALNTTTVSTFLGTFPPLLLNLLGVGLVLHSCHLIFASLRKTVFRLEIYYFSAGDQIWYLGSLLVLVSTDFVTTTEGIYATLSVAVMVMIIGLTQLWAYSEATDAGVSSVNLEGQADHDLYLPTNFSRLKAIGVSWMGTKLWVKIWLVLLNTVFLSAIYFWPTHLAQVTLASYAATMPLLLSIMIVERGLTRLLGIGHLITWIPLLIYIGFRLRGDLANPAIDLQTDPVLYYYAIILFAFTAICLAFDAYDVARWCRGKKGRLGSTSEHRF